MSNSAFPITFETNELLAVTIKQGDITEELVDVVINSTTPKLHLDAGTLSRSILKAAGTNIQDECSLKYPNGIKKGEIAITEGGNLQVGAIYHGALSSWLSDDGETDLCSFIRCFLDKAHEEGKLSMAIPAIATGVLMFPHKTVAKIMYTEICRFSNSNPFTTLKDIRIVLIFEEQLVQEFSSFFLTLKKRLYEFLYHYTSEENVKRIENSGHLKCSSKVAALGEGVYFTDLPPSTDISKIVYNNWGLMENHAKYTAQCKFTEWCIRFPKAQLVSKLEMREMDDRRVYVYRDQVDLDNFDYEVTVDLRKYAFEVKKVDTGVVLNVNNWQWVVPAINTINTMAVVLGAAEEIAQATPRPADHKDRDVKDQSATPRRAVPTPDKSKDGDDKDHLVVFRRAGYGSMPHRKHKS